MKREDAYRLVDAIYESRTEIGYLIESEFEKGAFDAFAAGGKLFGTFPTRAEARAAIFAEDDGGAA